MMKSRIVTLAALAVIVVGCLVSGSVARFNERRSAKPHSFVSPHGSNSNDRSPRGSSKVFMPSDVDAYNKRSEGAREEIRQALKEKRQTTEPFGACKAPFADILIISMEFDTTIGLRSDSQFLETMLDGFGSNYWKTRAVATPDVNGTYFWLWPMPPPVQKFNIIFVVFNGGFFSDFQITELVQHAASANATVFLIGSADSLSVQTAFNSSVANVRPEAAGAVRIRSLLPGAYTRGLGRTANILLNSDVGTFYRVTNETGLTVWYRFGQNFTVPSNATLPNTPAIFSRNLNPSGSGRLIVFNMVLNFLVDSQDAFFVSELISFMLSQTYVCIQQVPLYPDTLVAFNEFSWAGNGISSAYPLYQALAGSGYTPNLYDITGGRTDQFGSAYYLLNLADLYMPAYRRLIIYHNGWDSYFDELIDAALIYNVNIMIIGCTDANTTMGVYEKYTTAINRGFVTDNAQLLGNSTRYARFSTVNMPEYYCWDIDPQRLGVLGTEVLMSKKFPNVTTPMHAITRRRGLNATQTNLMVWSHGPFDDFGFVTISSVEIMKQMLLDVQTVQTTGTTGTTGVPVTTAAPTTAAPTTRSTNTGTGNTNEQIASEDGSNNSGVVGGIVAGWIISVVLLCFCFVGYIVVQRRKQTKSYNTSEMGER